MKVLPDGWHLCVGQTGRYLAAELARGIPEGHRLFGVDVDVVAVYGDEHDDILLSVKDDPSQWLIVHLTRGEGRNPKGPLIVFEGCWQDLLTFAQSNHSNN